MEEQPFLESSHISAQNSAQKAWWRNAFLEKHCQDYNLGAMAITFGVGIAIFGLIFTAIGVFSILSLPTIPWAPTIGYICFALWGAFSLWLWITLVMIAKTDRNNRVSDLELLVLQALFLGSMIGPALSSSQHDWRTIHEISLGFEWLVLAFHFIYFMLALCVWVRLPWRSYASFVVLLVVAILQSMYFN